MLPKSGTKAPRVRWWLEGEPTGLTRALVADPEGVLQSSASVARSRVGRKRFFRVRRRPDESALYVKVFALPGFAARLSYLLRPSKARRELAVGRALAARGFAVATPTAVGEERRFGLLRRSYSAIPEHPGRDLRAFLSDPAMSSAERRRALESFARFSRRLHDAGVDQDDFSPNNFLLGPDGALRVLDLERCSLRQPLRRARRWRLLAKLQRHELGVSRTERLRFLASYLEPESSRAERRATWLGLSRELARVRRRDARRAARAAFSTGRNLGRTGDEWFVRGREHVPVLRLELGARAARRAWIRAHQLERLRLPALRPVRLGRDWLELELPPASARPPEAGAIARAERRLLACGRFVRPPEWVAGPDGARLRDPGALRLGRGCARAPQRNR